MKKIVEIKIIVDMNHEEKDSWLTEKMFAESELDEAIDSIARTSKGKYKKRSGKTQSGACSYSMNITNENKHF